VYKGLCLDYLRKFKEIEECLVAVRLKGRVLTLCSNEALQYHESNKVLEHAVEHAG